MAVLQVADVTPDGADPGFVDADLAGDEFPNDQHTTLHVRNNSLALVTVTIASQRQCDQGFIHDQEVDVPAGGERQMGPFSKARFNGPDARVQISYSAAADVQVAVASL